MPIKWETHNVVHKGKTYIVTHWAKHDPKEIVEAINKKAVARPDGRVGWPKKYAFKKQFLAVRHGPHATGYFHTLCQMADDRSALIETPVALVRGGRRAGHRRLVTLWKGDKTLVSVHLPTTSSEERERVVLNAVRQLAKLHAKGYIHGHPHRFNFVIGKTGRARLIDVRLVDSATDIKRKKDLETFAELNHISGDPYGRKIQQEYQKTYDKFKRVKE